MTCREALTFARAIREGECLQPGQEIALAKWVESLLTSPAPRDIQVHVDWDEVPSSADKRHFAAVLLNEADTMDEGGHLPYLEFHDE